MQQRSRTRRAELITAILQDEDDPGAVAVDVLMGRLYPHTPLRPAPARHHRHGAGYHAR